MEKMLYNDSDYPLNVYVYEDMENGKTKRTTMTFDKPSVQIKEDIIDETSK